MNNISDTAIVLSRTNYGETDRILNLLCAKHGKLSAIAKGVRAGKSKLAGGVELFAENELVLLKARSDLYIVTSSRMKNYFGDIAKDIDASSYAYDCLKTINKLVPEGSGEDYYKPLFNLLNALNKAEIPLDQLKIWFTLKIFNNLGSLPNFMSDFSGHKLSPDANFEYDFDKHCFYEKPDGAYTSNHIKILRHLSGAPKPSKIESVPDSTMQETVHVLELILKADSIV